MSWKPEYIADNSGKWCGNILRFATKQEAEENAARLKQNWVLVTDTRAVESLDPVNAKWVDGKTVHLESWKDDV